VNVKMFQFTFVSGVPCTLDDAHEHHEYHEFQFTFVSGVPCTGLMVFVVPGILLGFNSPS